MSDLFRAIPAVDASLNALLDVDPTLEAAPRPLLRTAVTEFWDALREDIRQGRVTRPADLALDANLSALLAHVRRALLPRLRPVLNATGVVVHTNMGRSVLATAALPDRAQGSGPDP
ncbi:hypothetical protein [uncultured Desulfovibrio sp.]|uniref:hypothetical protein n=1 Tax=uncultured Desulfovibrio sp. TaxID=167968 RepID=UPI0025980380|nr:hypothetical protein [uncultured Desulfovibrio sp.]